MSGGDHRAPIRVFIVEDHAAFRQALAFVFDREPDFEVIAQAGSVGEARQNMPNDADLTVLDLAMPDGMGYELIEDLHGSRPGAAVLILSATLSQQNTLKAVEAGADGVVDKLAGLDEIVEAARGVLSGRVAPAQREVMEILHLYGRRSQFDPPAQEASLAAGELEALKALAEGLDDRGVAQRLGVSVEEERALVEGVLAKLGARSRLHALLLAARRGHVEMPG